jgi:hypothetical protein
MPAPAHDDAAHAAALEIDVATSLALTRATTRAVSRLSADAQREMLSALKKEAQVQQAHGGPVGELVAALIAAYAEELK